MPQEKLDSHAYVKNWEMHSTTLLSVVLTKCYTENWKENTNVSRETVWESKKEK